MISSSTPRRPRSEAYGGSDALRGRDGFGLRCYPPETAGQASGLSEPVPDEQFVERAEGVRRRSVTYVFHSDFNNRRVRRELVAEVEPARPRPGSERRPSNVSSYVASLYSTPLLSREEEAGLFRRMNGLKHLAAEIQDRVDPEFPDADDLEGFDRLMVLACATRNAIVQANLRLVFALAKRFAGRDQEEFGECVAEGNVALMRAVEHFDFSRGHRFSTYAHHAIRRQLLQRVQAEVRRREWFVTGGDEAAQSLDGDDGRAIRQDQRSRLAKQAIQNLLPCLSDRERSVIEVRFGLGEHSRQTFEEIGRRLGVSKERVRQLQARALYKLARSAGSSQEARAWEDALA